MLVIATSDVGGSGRSVTGANLCYQWALQGNDVCYLDFDFGSPTAATVFGIEHAERGTDRGGLQSYLQGLQAVPHRIDVWAESGHPDLRARPPGAGRLVLFPGDEDGAEFASTAERMERCAQLLLRIEEEFDFCLVDVSAGRSYAAGLMLAATARQLMRQSTVRWLVLHRWNRRHILAAAGLVYGAGGLIQAGQFVGHDPQHLAASIRFVRTLVRDPGADQRPDGLPAWAHEENKRLQEVASRNRLGLSLVLGSVPDEPALHWQERLITANDVHERRIANQVSLDAYQDLAKAVTTGSAWEAP